MSVVLRVQVEVYRGLLRTKRITSLLYGVGSGGGDSEGVLPAITVLKKLCNHPKLLATHTEEQEGAATQQQQQQPQQRKQQQQKQQEASSKACSKTAELAASILQQHLPGTGASLDAIELSGVSESCYARHRLLESRAAAAPDGSIVTWHAWHSTNDGWLRRFAWSVLWSILLPPGKLQTLSALLSGIAAEGSKVVVVSTSTTALDMIDNLLCAPNR